MQWIIAILPSDRIAAYDIQLGSLIAFTSNRHKNYRFNIQIASVTRRS